MTAPDTTPAVRIVPVEPTREMLLAMDTNNAGYRMGLGLDFLRDVWAAALAAAPVAPGGEGDEVEIAAKAYADATDYYVQFHRGLSSPSADKIRTGIRAALAALRARSSPDLSGGGFDLASFRAMVAEKLEVASRDHADALFPMGPEEAALYHQTRADLLGWVLDMLPSDTPPLISAALSPSREGVEPEAGAVEPAGWMRRWAFDGEAEYKVVDKTTGRKRLHPKFTLYAVTRKKCLPDDVALYTHPTPADDRLAVAVEAVRHYACSCEPGHCAMSDDDSDTPVDDMLCGRKAAQALALLTKSGEAEG